MHLSSRFLTSAIQNADLATQDQFLLELKELTHQKNLDIFSPAASESGRSLGLKTSHSTLPQKFVEHLPSIAYIEAALRLAALFHDLGHLPFSHDFEYSLSEAIGRMADTPNLNAEGDRLKRLLVLAPHEVLGHEIAPLILKVVEPSISSNGSLRGIYSAFDLATKILNSSKQHSDRQGLVDWLHSLVDGEVDADRADYLLRDGRALGLDFASYDLDRLARSIALHYDSTNGFSTVVDYRGLTALESFFLSRARSHHAFVRHHKSAQIAAAFRHISTSLLISDSMKGFRNDLLKIIEHDNNYTAESFSRYTDHWWMESILQQAGTLRMSPLGAACFDLIMHRKPTLRSVWKREGDLSDHDTLRLRGALKKIELPTNQRIVTKRMAEEHNLLLAVHKFKPYSGLPGTSSKTESAPVSRLQMRLGNNKYAPVSQMSPLLQALYHDWEKSLPAHVFALTTDSRSASDIVETLSQIADSAVPQISQQENSNGG